MKLLITTLSGMTETVESDILPRVGDRVDLLYTPWPTVDGVLLWPRNEYPDSNGDLVKFDAIITVS